MAVVQIEKPRLFQSTKDIVLSLGVLLFAMFLTVGFTGLCSFNPGPADKTGHAQEVDSSTFLHMEARAMDFPIVEPTMPEGWVTNSARRTQVAGELGSLVGWVIDGENYISLTQTAATVEDAAQADGEVREQTGKITAGQDEWAIFTGDDIRPRWIADRGDHRLVLEGMANKQQMTTAAEKVSAAPAIDVAQPAQPEKPAQPE